jgi:PPOX class probable F420-dependent enzyme
MRLSSEEAAGRFRVARVARLATVDAAGEPHLIPVTFVSWDNVVVTAVDHKPKSSLNLKRLRNIEQTGHVSLLVDEYDDRDWTQLWWARADGNGQVLSSAGECPGYLERLCEKYHQYRVQPPVGPAIRVEVDRFTGWAY